MRGHGHGHGYGYGYGRPPLAYGWGRPLMRPWGLGGGLFGWLILGGLGFLLGKNYTTAQSPTAEREAALAQREAEVRQREAALRQRESTVNSTAR